MGELYTDDTNNDDTDNDDDNDTRWTNHDCIGSLPNEPKSPKYTLAEANDTQNTQRLNFP